MKSIITALLLINSSVSLLPRVATSSTPQTAQSTTSTSTGSILGSDGVNASNAGQGENFTDFQVLANTVEIQAGNLGVDLRMQSRGSAVVSTNILKKTLSQLDQLIKKSAYNTDVIKPRRSCHSARFYKQHLKNLRRYPGYYH